VAALDAGEIESSSWVVSRGSQAVLDGGQIVDDETRVSFAGGGELLLDSDMELLRSSLEPAAAARLQRPRLWQLFEPEHGAVECTRGRLTAGRSGDLDVVDADDRHPPRSTIDSVVEDTVAQAQPRLEDTLVSGYARLASDAPHRRIDLELRGLDIVLSAVLAVVTLPIAAVLALIVLVTSGRPVLYRGPRVGRGGRVFTMLKFRTLGRGAEQRIGQFLGEELVRHTEDEFTPIGRWLKASQLDEIPQLWNVLRGDMSFVGPRPIRPRFFAELTQDLPAYWQRLVVRPGLTGLAQVRRGYETSMAEKLAHDLEWIADRSVPLYLRTMVVTGLRVLRQTFSRHGQK
jgi:lipopolysaccharide/colanic/teichoic acid biosynthesis glycosyltransferase